MKTKTLVALILAVSALLMTGCDSSTPSTTSPSTSTTVGIHGKFSLGSTSSLGRSLAGLTVRLHSTGDTTKTDATGAWSFPAIASRSAVVAAARTTSGTDSVTVSTAGSGDTATQSIITIPVVADSTLLVTLVYHELRGCLSNPKPGHAYIIRVREAKPDGDTSIIQTWWNATVNQFSGFVFTPSNFDTVKFQARVYDVADTNTLIGVGTTGMNGAVPTNLAGGIKFGGFGYTNIGLHSVVTNIPTTPVSYNGQFTLSVRVGDTTPSGTGLRAPYTLSYKVGDSSWAGLGSSSGSAVPLTVYAGTALISNPQILIRIQDAAGVSSIDTFSITTNTTAVKCAATLYYAAARDSSRVVLWYDTVAALASSAVFPDTTLYSPSPYVRVRRDTSFSTLTVSLPVQVWDTTGLSAHRYLSSESSPASGSRLYVNATVNTVYCLLRFTTSDTLRSAADGTVYLPGSTVNYVTYSNFTITRYAAEGGTFIGTPSRIRILGAYALN